MKQLILNVIIEQNNDCYELIALPDNTDNQMLMTYCRGRNESEVLNYFLNSLSNHYIRYWYILEDK